MELIYGSRRIPYTVSYSKNRKTIKLTVAAPDKVEIVAPEGTPDEVIEQAVASRAKWVVEQLFDLKDVRHQQPEREYVSGESFLYLGRSFALDLQVDPQVMRTKVDIVNQKLVVDTNSDEPSLVKKVLIGWYRKQAKQFLTERVEYYATKMGVSPVGVTIKDQQKRWGSCTKSNRLIFNFRVVMAPSNIIDYVVVHELCHLTEKGHSPRFWKLVASALPDYEERKRWLLNNGAKLDV
jgi:predicted metal-dependent hydrolase